MADNSTRHWREKWAAKKIMIRKSRSLLLPITQTKMGPYSLSISVAVNLLAMIINADACHRDNSSSRMRCAGSTKISGFLEHVVFCALLN